MSKYSYWTEEEEVYLECAYGKIPVSQIAKVINRSRKAVEKKAVKKGLKSKVPGSPLYDGNPNAYRPVKEDHHAYRLPLVPWVANGRMYVKRDHDSRPESYARYVWEQEHGLIPDTQILAHKDGNPFNPDLANLELITRAENMKRNTIHRFPPELKEQIRLLAKLNRKIKSINDAS